MDYIGANQNARGKGLGNGDETHAGGLGGLDPVEGVLNDLYPAAQIRKSSKGRSFACALVLDAGIVQ